MRNPARTQHSAGNSSSNTTSPVGMNLIRKESEYLIDNDCGVINGFFDLLRFWFINLAGITMT
jgi:hypothetical protein